jgi:hypothetical protein
LGTIALSDRFDARRIGFTLSAEGCWWCRVGRPQSWIGPAGYAPEGVPLEFISPEAATINSPAMTTGLGAGDPIRTPSPERAPRRSRGGSPVPRRLRKTSSCALRPALPRHPSLATRGSPPATPEQRRCIALQNPGCQGFSGAFSPLSRNVIHAISKRCTIARGGNGREDSPSVAPRASRPFAFHENSIKEES